MLGLADFGPNGVSTQQQMTVQKGGLTLA